VSTSDVSGDGAPTAGYITRLDTLAGNIVGTSVVVGAGGTTTFIGGVWSKKFAGFFPYTLLASTPFFATQRRRSAYGRPNVNPFA